MAQLLLDIVVQVFVRVALGGREVEQLDLVAMAQSPGLDPLGVVHLQVIYDQEHLLLCVLDQPPQEDDEAIDVKRPIIQHEAHQGAVGDGRNHALGDLLGGPANHRRLASWGITAADLVLVGDAGLVAPVDDGSLSLGAPGDRRVVALQPGGHGGGRALFGARQRLLRGHAPALQVELDGRQAKALAQPALDQLAHRTGRPQCKRQFELIGRLVGDPAADLPALLGGQRPLALASGNPTTIQEAVLAPFAIPLEPDVDRLPLHANNPGRLGPARSTLLDKHDRPTPEFLLRRPTNATKVTRFHAPCIAQSDQYVRYYFGILVTSGRWERVSSNFLRCRDWSYGFGTMTKIGSLSGSIMSCVP